MKNLLIIFVKNIVLGKVKTRLANTIGTQGAFEVYKYMVEKLEKETSNLSCEKHIYFSDVIIKEKWANDSKFLQSEGDIGERMRNAFKNAFNEGYEYVVLIGSDIPDLNAEILKEAFTKLETCKTVFGPAEDGGYYLVGLTEMNDAIFKDIDWSTAKVLNQTLSKVSDYQLLKILNDIDTYGDLKKSTIWHKFEYLNYI